MRVQSIDPMKSELSARTDAVAQQSTDRPTLFRRTVTTLAKENYELHIKDALESITKQGEKVVKRADLCEMHKYREMIRDLLSETVSNGYEFSKFSRFDSRGRSKVFALIQKVNDKLSNMADELLKEEADKIKLLADMDDIRGMLVDILM